MKKLILLVIFCLGMNIGIYAQEILSRDKFWAIIWEAEAKADKAKHQKILEQNAKRGKNTYYRKEIYRYTPPNKSYTFTENSTPEGIETSEEITIGEKYYRKDGTSGWRFIPPNEIIRDGTGSESDVKSSSEKVEYNEIIKNNAEYRFVGNTVLNGKNVKEYSFTSIDEYSTTKHHYFISEMGLMVKIQEDLIIGDYVDNRVEVFEYDSLIEIVAPKLQIKISRRQKKSKR
jgi:hypothetical protein